MLVIGPNRVFLRYIERVLPSLGEAGIEQVVLADLVPDVQFARPGSVDDDPPLTARVKGDDRMSDVIDRAVRDRQRPLRDDLVLPYGVGYVRLRAAESERIVKAARRRFRRHNAARRFVEGEVWSALAATAGRGDVSPGEIKDALRFAPEMRAALDWMWPVLTPAQLLHDLFGSRALLKSACRGVFTDREALALYRERSEHVDQVRWTTADVALLDDAREVLGPKPRKRRRGDQPSDDDDEIRTYGHIVIDEVQDLTPMQLKMATRRSLNGSMTIVGDIAQATGALAPTEWDDVLQHLPDRRPFAGDRAVRRLSHPRPDHGARQPGDGSCHPRIAGAGLGPGGRRRAVDRARRVADGPRRGGGVGDRRAARDPAAVEHRRRRPRRAARRRVRSAHRSRGEPRQRDPHGARRRASPWCR